jgi:signal transduction histidine kinase
MALAPVPARTTWKMSLGSFRWSAGTPLALLARVVDDVRARAEPGHSPRRDAPARPLAIDIDPGRIEQLLINAIDSATRRRPDGDDGEVVVRLGRRDGALERRVQDGGIGVPPDMLGATGA